MKCEQKWWLFVEETFGSNESFSIPIGQKKRMSICLHLRIQMRKKNSHRAQSQNECEIKLFFLMPEKLWCHCNLTYFVMINTCLSFFGKFFVVIQNVKYGVIIWSSNSTPKYISKRNENISTNKNVYMNILSSIIS